MSCAKTLAFTQHEWIHQKAVFVDEVDLHQRLCQKTTTNKEDVLSRPMRNDRQSAYQASKSNPAL
jgi:hypothetical protein